MTWKCRLVGDERIEVVRYNKTIGYYELLKEPYCKKCCYPYSKSSYGCPYCEVAYGFESVYAVGIYYTTRTYKLIQNIDPETGDLLSKHIYLFKKFSGYYSKPLALAMALCLKYKYKLTEDIDIITSVPAHSEKIREIGHNRIDLLGEIISKKLGIPFDNSLLCKTQNISMHYEENGEMKSRPLEERYEIVKGLYKPLKQIPGKRVLLIDDIYTTGADVSECSFQLLEAGAENVKVMVAGRSFSW